jgi:tellurite resistance protein TerC
MNRLRRWLRRNVPYRTPRRVMVAVIGGTVLLVGVAMMVLPGPAFIVVPVGLGILGLEFAWARYWLRRLRTKARELAASVRGRQRPG